MKCSNTNSVHFRYIGQKYFTVKGASFCNLVDLPMLRLKPQLPLQIRAFPAVSSISTHSIAQQRAILFFVPQGLLTYTGIVAFRYKLLYSLQWSEGRDLYSRKMMKILYLNQIKYSLKFSWTTFHL